MLRLDGKSLLRTPPHKVVRRGIARTFQNVELFRTMTVLENVLVGGHTRSAPFGGRVARTRVEVLRYVGLERLAERPVSGLPFGTLKRVELARALAAEPRLLLLDEPAGGLNHEEVAELGTFIRELRDDSRAHRAARRAPHGACDGLADRSSSSTSAGRSRRARRSEVQRDPAVIEAYLGEAGRWRAFCSMGRLPQRPRSRLFPTEDGRHHGFGVVVRADN